MDSRWSITNRLALVTGGSRRLGRAIALELARAGADVVVHGRQVTAETRETVGAIRRYGRQAWVLAADLSDCAQAESLVEQAAVLAGRPVEILVNNAAIFPPGILGELTEGELLNNLRINAFSPLFLTRALARNVDDGVAIQLLDARMLTPDSGHIAYHAAKRLLFTFTRLLAAELAPAIRVNGVSPGAILPPPGGGSEVLVRRAAEVPLRRCGTPEDVAAALCFLVQSPFITGQVIHVDGGRHLKGNTYVC